MSSNNKVSSLAKRGEWSIDFFFGNLSLYLRSDLSCWIVRNRFIRDMGEGSFMEMDTQNLCKRLKIPDEVILQEEDPTPRHLFVFGTAILAQQLMYRANEANLEKREPRDNFILVNIE